MLRKFSFSLLDSQENVWRQCSLLDCNDGNVVYFVLSNTVVRCDCWVLDLWLVWLRNWILNFIYLKLNSCMWPVATILDSIKCSKPLSSDWADIQCTTPLQSITLTLELYHSLVYRFFWRFFYCYVNPHTLHH